MELVSCATRKGTVYYEKSLTERFDAICKFADAEGIRDNLEEALARVTFPTFFGKPARTILGYDFYQHSLGFVVQIQDKDGAWKFAMNGGFIWNESDKNWGIHT